METSGINNYSAYTGYDVGVKPKDRTEVDKISSEKTQSKTDGSTKDYKKYLTENTSNAYLNNLRQKYSNVNITVADFSSEKQLKSYMFGCGGYNNIAISSSIIEKMASDPATAAKYEKVIADAPNLGEEFKSECAALGTELLSCGTVIDKDGNVSYWGIGRMKEDVENPGTLYKEKVQKQLEEKRTEKKKQEKAESNRTEKEKAQELRMVSAKTKKELISKIRKNETQEISAGMVEKMISEDGSKGARVDYLI